MKRLTISVDDDFMALLQKIPTQSRGKFIKYAINNFCKTEAGRQLLNFFNVSSATVDMPQPSDVKDDIMADFED